MSGGDRGRREYPALIGTSAEDALADARMRVAAEPGLAAPGRWVFSGACLDADPDLFFPVGSLGPGVHQIAEAKAICGRCLVTTDCLSYALATGQDAGVWGGTTEQERRALRSRGSAGKAPATA
jgi:WhiB family redox-sensing transcriptional regulator